MMLKPGLGIVWGYVTSRCFIAYKPSGWSLQANSNASTPHSLEHFLKQTASDITCFYFPKPHLDCKAQGLCWVTTDPGLLHTFEKLQNVTRQASTYRLVVQIDRPTHAYLDPPAFTLPTPLTPSQSLWNTTTETLEPSGHLLTYLRAAPLQLKSSPLNPSEAHAHYLEAVKAIDSYSLSTLRRFCSGEKIPASLKYFFQKGKPQYVTSSPPSHAAPLAHTYFTLIQSSLPHQRALYHAIQYTSYRDQIPTQFAYEGCPLLGEVAKKKPMQLLPSKEIQPHLDPFGESEEWHSNFNSQNQWVHQTALSKSQPSTSQQNLDPKAKNLMEQWNAPFSKAPFEGLALQLYKLDLKPFYEFIPASPFSSIECLEVAPPTDWLHYAPELFNSSDSSNKCK